MPLKKSKKTKKMFQAPKGMRDILPEEQIYWEKIRQVVHKIAKSYGFERLDTPILEEEGLFIKGTGLSTDIVQKEMYSFRTKGRDRLVLRPEFTPAFIRAYLEDGLASRPHPLKLYTIGPLFRYERSQKGRYRQHEQANFEVIGENDPVLDAQLIQAFFSIIRGIGFKDIVTQINSIGCRQCRPNYRRKLVAFYNKRKRELCSDCQKRLKQNPLRLLDCKNERCIAATEEAPQTIDNLCPDCHNHFKNILEYLDELEIPYILNPRLVRGLDYYTKMVFEVWPEEEGGRQSALGGGGRYDNLVKTLGGRETSGVGFGMGIDRLVNLMKEKKIKVSGESSPPVFLVQLGELGKKKALKLFEDLRRANIRIASQFSKDTMKEQLKSADKIKAPFALILGQKEALDETVIIRNMESGSQETVPLKKVVKTLKKRIKR
ncbi:histidine--tRNA ligase [Patescibacteria group bacterium]|nr:histidine--tRNA ligase [Patescibacteria group bacterium]